MGCEQNAGVRMPGCERRGANARVKTHRVRTELRGANAGCERRDENARVKMHGVRTERSGCECQGANTEVRTPGCKRRGENASSENACGRHATRRT